MGTTRSSSLKAAVKRKKAIETEHFVPVDDEQAARLQFAEQRLNLARFSSNEEDIAASEVALEEVRAEARKTGVSFVIRGIGRKKFEELIREHPPTKEQAEDSEATFNPDTFWAAFFELSIVGGMTAEEWQTEVIDSPDWGPGELAELRNKTMAVNTGTRVAQLGN